MGWMAHEYLTSRCALDHQDIIDNLVAKNHNLCVYELSTDDWDAITLATQCLKYFWSAIMYMSTTKHSLVNTCHLPWTMSTVSWFVVPLDQHWCLNSVRLQLSQPLEKIHSTAMVEPVESNSCLVTNFSTRCNGELTWYRENITHSGCALHVPLFRRYFGIAIHILSLNGYTVWPSYPSNSHQKSHHCTV